jgi:transcriptional regulator with XRE-family HTH domain
VAVDHFIVRELRAARLVSGRTQQNVAAAVPVNQSTVSEWETGSVDPTLTSTLRWARALGYDLVLVPRASATGGVAAREAPPNDLPAVLREPEGGER